MTRLCVLDPRFRKALDRLGIEAGTERGRAVGRTIASLATAKTLPAVTDTEACIPPTRRAFVRRVQGRNLWIWFRVVDGGAALVLSITSEPPTPID